MSQTDEPTSGRFEGRAHYLPVRIYYEDTDFSGLVYHANYVRYFERGRSDFLRAAGINHSALLEGDSPTVFAAVSINLKFLKAARIDDALVVRTTFDVIKGARMYASQAVFRGDDVIAEAQVEVCCISLQGKPRRVPPLLIQQMAAYLDQSSSPF